MAALQHTPPPPAAAATGPRSWLLVYNCVHLGLANCLKLQAPGLQLEAVDFAKFRRNYAQYEPLLAGYDTVVTSQQFVKNEHVDFSQVTRVRTLPMLHFDAYHPDMCYVSSAAGELLKGPMGGYQSKIVVAAYVKGMKREQVAALFTGRNYESFGYLEFWGPARARLLRGFADHGVPLDAVFPRWGARNAFMHSGNHPAIQVVSDVASALLESEGITPVRTALMPHDNLLNGPVFPVYPEIAEHLSVPGSMLFKVPTEYRYLDLSQFIAACWETLSEHDPASLQLNASHQASFDEVLARL
jgi:hypothetical protein